MTGSKVEDMIEVLEFTCPDCGSHEFGSGMPWEMRGRTFTEVDYAEHMEGHCHGRFETPRESRACNFTWKRKYDTRYFRGTGRFKPRVVAGRAP